RTAEQIDPGRDHRRPHAVVVEDQRLDQIVEMALVVRDVDDPAFSGRLLGDLDVLVNALDLPENGVERVFQRAVDRVALGGAQLVEIPVNALARLGAGGAMSPAQIPRYILARQNGL